MSEKGPIIEKSPIKLMVSANISILAKDLTIINDNVQGIKKLIKTFEGKSVRDAFESNEDLKDFEQTLTDLENKFKNTQSDSSLLLNYKRESEREVEDFYSLFRAFTRSYYNKNTTSDHDKDVINNINIKLDTIYKTINTKDVVEHLEHSLNNSSKSRFNVDEVCDSMYRMIRSSFKIVDILNSKKIINLFYEKKEFYQEENKLLNKDISYLDKIHELKGELLNKANHLYNNTYYTTCEASYDVTDKKKNGFAKAREFEKFIRNSLTKETEKEFSSLVKIARNIVELAEKDYEIFIALEKKSDVFNKLVERFRDFKDLRNRYNEIINYPSQYH